MASNIDRISKAASVIGINEVEDECFDEIDHSPTIKRLKEYVALGSLYCGLFSFLFVTFGIVAHFGYENKGPLAFLGLISTFHSIGFLVGWIGLKKKLRFVLLSMAMLNLCWIFCVSLLITYCLFLLTDKEMKEEFNSEIVFHVGLLVYYPLAIAYAASHLLLVHTLYTSKAKRESFDEDTVTEKTELSESITSEPTKSKDTKQSNANKFSKRKSSDSLNSKDKRLKANKKPRK